MPNQPKTPARSVRLSDEDWSLAADLAADLARESGLPANRADVLRIALHDLADRRGVSATGKTPKKKSKKSE
jgi:hypothetical protein